MITVTSLTHPTMYRKFLNAMKIALEYGECYVKNRHGKQVVRVRHSKQIGFMFDCGTHGDITTIALKAVRRCRGRQKLKVKK